MGVLTDFVVAGTSEAKRVGGSLCPSKEFGGLDAKGIDPVMLGTLYGVLTGKPCDPSFVGDAALRFTASDEGPWVFEVPQDLVRELANCNSDRLVAVAVAWAKTEEFSPKYGDWSFEAVKQLLESLATLCQQAIGQNKAVFMWMCL